MNYLFYLASLHFFDRLGRSRHPLSSVFRRLAERHKVVGRRPHILLAFYGILLVQTNSAPPGINREATLCHSKRKMVAEFRATARSTNLAAGAETGRQFVSMYPLSSTVAPSPTLTSCSRLSPLPTPNIISIYTTHYSIFIYDSDHVVSSRCTRLKAKLPATPDSDSPGPYRAGAAKIHDTTTGTSHSYRHRRQRRLPSFSIHCRGLEQRRAQCLSLSHGASLQPS